MPSEPPLTRKTRDSLSGAREASSFDEAQCWLVGGVFRRVVDLHQLVCHCVCDLPTAVAYILQLHPGYEVEIAVAVDVLDPTALSPFDDVEAAGLG